jgi:predicted KAP-like P-loop ATPase
MRKVAHEEKLPDLKASIAEALRTQSKRILIIIDDIDRLTAEEVGQLFRFVKAVADFPYGFFLPN